MLYLLHGNNQPATAFLEIGLQAQLDGLIARHAIPPMIVVMIQGGPGANNWRPWEGRDYEAYVLEVQQLVDRMLPTIADRAARAIAGDSMGGYGAMRAALENPYRFSVVESWLGFFNGLEGELRADRAVLARLGLRALLYGASRGHDRRSRPRTRRSRPRWSRGGERPQRGVPRRTQPRNDRSPPRPDAHLRGPRARATEPPREAATALVELARPRARPASAVGASSLGALAVGALAFGAGAVGALAIGRLAIGRLAIGRGRCRLDA